MALLTAQQTIPMSAAVLRQNWRKVSSTDNLQARTLHHTTTAAEDLQLSQC
jgi:hypothetical protein